MIFTKYGIQVEVPFPGESATWLAEGVFGTVYRLSEDRVIKFQILETFLPREDGIERDEVCDEMTYMVTESDFLKEVQIFQLFSKWKASPLFLGNGILKGIFLDNQKPCRVGYIISKYIKSTLGQKWKAGLDIKQEDFLQQLRSVLQNFWSYYGMVVVDIHCNNILIDDKGQMFICDFGVVKDKKIYDSFDTYYDDIN